MPHGVLHRWSKPAVPELGASQATTGRVCPRQGEEPPSHPEPEPEQEPGPPPQAPPLGRGERAASPQNLSTTTEGSTGEESSQEDKGGGASTGDEATKAAATPPGAEAKACGNDVRSRGAHTGANDAAPCTGSISTTDDAPRTRGTGSDAVTATKTKACYQQNPRTWRTRGAPTEAGPPTEGVQAAAPQGQGEIWQEVLRRQGPPLH